jgi:RNA polymerase primary sigma factor
MTDEPLDSLGLLDEPLDVEESDSAQEAGGSAPLPADRLLYPHVPRLSVDEEVDLAGRIAEGDAGAEARLVESHIYLAIAAARRQLGRGVAFADLVQEGTLGLVIAARRWRPTGEARFATYAEHWVTARVRRAIATGSLVLTANAEARRGQIAGVRDRLRRELSRDPSEEELAHAAGLTLRQLRTPRPTVVSLDNALGEMGDDATFGDTAEARVPAPSDGTEQLAIARQLHAAMGRARLTERERAVLWLRYGLDDEEPRGLRDIGEALGIKHASQLVAHEASALRKLRAALGEAAAGQQASSGSGISSQRSRRPGSSSSRKSASSAGSATPAMARAGRT